MNKFKIENNTIFLERNLEIANASKRVRWNLRRRHTYLTY